jgi:hypothetical protein
MTTELTLGVPLESPYRIMKQIIPQVVLLWNGALLNRARSRARLISARTQDRVEHSGEGEHFGDQEQLKWAQGQHGFASATLIATTANS